MKKIGVFDSGFGGINVLRGMVKLLPEYDYVYLGDTARTPYGTRSKLVVLDFTKQALEFLFNSDCDLIVIACNTASSDALKKIQRKWLPEEYPDKHVLGVLVPAAEEAINNTKNNRIGVIATRGTVNSGAFTREIHKLNKQTKVFEGACPLLVPMVESNEINTHIAELLLQRYLSPLLKHKIDTLILGCTHYGILEHKIQKIVGKDICIISEARVVPPRLKDYLQRHTDIESKIGKKGKVRFCTTDLTKQFQEFGSKFFGKSIHAHHADLGSR